MNEDFFSIEGLLVPPEALTLVRARSVAKIATSAALPYVSFVESRSQSEENGRVETVVLDLSVERPQKAIHDIKHTERIAIVFNPLDSAPPEVLSLRKGFPLVPHINLRNVEFPRSLCLYDRPWTEVSPRWTAALFIERIRYWLTATSRGELHQEDQPLEPLLFQSGMRLVLTPDVYNDLKEGKDVELELFLANSLKECATLVGHRIDKAQAVRSGTKFVATTFLAAPQTHGLIRRSPANLAEVHAFLESGGINLLSSLRERLKNWSNPTLLGLRLVILVALPLKRKADGIVEAWNFWAFGTYATIQDIGVDVGVWDKKKVAGNVGWLLPPDEKKTGIETEIEVFSPLVAFSPESAASANEVPPEPAKIVAVGVGALGSQVTTTLYRMGFGNWTLVDEDDLLPHNLARHILHGDYIGVPKAIGLADYLNRIYSGCAKAIVANVLSAGKETEALTKAYAGATFILDMSASVVVARHLALDVASDARRVSVFLNPQGEDVVVLVEDIGRALTLDVLEAQYYKAVSSEKSLDGHLNANPGRVRYGRSCRDVSRSMPTTLVSMHSSLASELVRRVLKSDSASINILRCDRTSLRVTPVHVEPAIALKQKINGWNLVIDTALLSKLAGLRAAKLPNETGGVFVGLFDLNRKFIYVADTIPSPPDSAEWPTLYIRGSESLPGKLKEINDRTAGQLEYLGEWHSHPDSCAITPSRDDLNVFTWLTSHMMIAGLPALMAIVGERGRSGWYLGEMAASGGWQLNENE